MQLRIDSRLHLEGEIPPELRDAIRREFTYPNPAFGKAQAFGFKARVPRYLMSWQEPTGTRVPVTISVSRGGYDRLLRLLPESFLTIEARSFAHCRGRMPKHRVQLYDYQEKLVSEALTRLLSFPGTALWRAPQASGKTTAGLSLLARLQQKALVIVANSVLFRQWQDRVRSEMGFEAGQLGGGKFNIEPPIVIGMQQTLRSVSDEVLALFGAVLADELQLFAAETFQAVIDRIPAGYRIGVSGDERRADRKECLIYDQFGPVTSEVKSAELQAKGKIHEVEIRVVLSRFRCPWWSDIDRMPMLRNETEAAWRKRKIQRRMEMAEHLNEELGADLERLALVADLAQSCVAQAKNCIVLSTRREHCLAIDQQMVQRGLRTGLLIGGTDYRDQFDLTLRRFRADEIDVAVGTYQAIGVGFDLPKISRGVCTFPVANNANGRMQWQQYRGRFARTAPGKTDAVLYYVLDPEVYGFEPLRHLVRWNTNVNVVDLDTDESVPAKQYLQRRHENAKTQRWSSDTRPSGHDSAPDPGRGHGSPQSGTGGRRGNQAPSCPGFEPAVNGRDRLRRRSAAARGQRLDQPAADQSTPTGPRRRRRAQG